jgi:hypothetical protein
MKTIFLVLIVLSAATALGQAGAISSQGAPLQMSGHPLTAGPAPMASEHPLVGGGAGTYTYAQGERPLWEFGPVTEPTPLGDVARAYRKEKAAAKKAEVVLEKQGS